MGVVCPLSPFPLHKTGRGVDKLNHCFSFRARVLFYSPLWPGTHDPPAPVFRMLHYRSGLDINLALTGKLCLAVDI